MEWLKIYYHILSVGYIGLVIITAHLVAGKKYRWSHNTISELGAQGYNRSWIMRLGFVGFGLIMTGGILLKFMSGDVMYLIDIPVLLYALAILCTGIFSTGPFEDGLQYSETSNLLHYVFAMAAGVAISIALLMSALLAPTPQWRTLHVVFLILITLIYSMFGFRKKHSGLIQRVLYAASFVWLIVCYNL